MASPLQALTAARRASSLPLPPIPDGYVRLTHVMPDRSRQILSSGEPFLYGKHGLGGTTDSYSDNAAIEHLARTGDPIGGRADGSPSGWTRNSFGDHMALIDLPADAHKQIYRSLQFDDPIPNAAILGFVDRKAMAFEPNPRYDRAQIEQYGRSAVDRIRALLDEQLARPAFGVPDGGSSVPVARETDFSVRPAEDVW